MGNARSQRREGRSVLSTLILRSSSQRREGRSDLWLLRSIGYPIKMTPGAPPDHHPTSRYPRAPSAPCPCRGCLGQGTMTVMVSASTRPARAAPHDKTACVLAYTSRGRPLALRRDLLSAATHSSQNLGVQNTDERSSDEVTVAARTTKCGQQFSPRATAFQIPPWPDF